MAIRVEVEDLNNDAYFRGVDAGIQVATEQIIELLKRDVCPDWTLWCCDGWCGAYMGAIDLIREEVK